jgi:hypothetical protein
MNQWTVMNIPGIVLHRPPKTPPPAVPRRKPPEAGGRRPELEDERSENATNCTVIGMWPTGISLTYHWDAILQVFGHIEMCVIYTYIYICIYIHTSLCVRFSKKVQSTVETAPNEAIHCCWKQSLINSAYLLFKYWFSISWWRPAKPRTGTHFHSWLVLKQYVLALTGFRPRKPQGVDFVTIINFQFRASNYSRKCVCVNVSYMLYYVPAFIFIYNNDKKATHTHTYIYI